MYIRSQIDLDSNKKTLKGMTASIHRIWTL